MLYSFDPAASWRCRQDAAVRRRLQARRATVGWEASVAEHRATNIHVRDGIGEDEFVALREALQPRSAPALILPSLQVNIRAGRLPPADPDGTIRLRIPLTLAG